MFLFINSKLFTNAFSNRLLATIVFCFAGAGLVLSQNINKPNKTGPLGTEVNTFSGNLYVSRNDFNIAFRDVSINMLFSYNSFNYDMKQGFGNGWSFKYTMKYKMDTAGAIIITWGDGREDRYTFSSGNFVAPAGIFDVLAQYQPGKYRLRIKSGYNLFFDNSQNKRLTKIADPNGNNLVLTYSDSLVTAINTSAGQTVTFNYTGGRLSAVTDAVTAPARTFTYEYDNTGNLVKVTDPLGGKMQYRYLTNGPMSGITDKNMNEVDIIYTPDFSVSELIGCNSRKSFSYDTTLYRTTVTDYVPQSSNQITTYAYKKYNDQVWLTSISGNCCGYNMTYDFDAAGNVIKQTDASGMVYTSTYDDKGNLLTLKDPLNQLMTWTYITDFNKIATYTDTKGNLHTLSYDAAGNVIKLTEPGGLNYVATYNSTGDILTSTDPKGNKYMYSYDTWGNLSTVNGPNGFVINYTYDARGNMLTETDAKGNKYTGQYDILDRMKTLTDPLNLMTKVNYDASGNVTGIINKNNEAGLLAYDASDRLVKYTDEMGKQSTFTYDAMDNPLSFTNPLGNTATFSYDNRNRLNNTKDPLGNSNNFSYDANGSLTGVTYPSGRVVTKTYDAIGRIISQQDATGSLGAVTYDANSNVTSFTNGSGAVTTATYDNLNRVKTLTDALGNTETYAYDENDNITSFTDKSGHTSLYTYDSTDRLKTYTDNIGAVITLTYDATDNITTVKDQNNNTTTYTYDSLNRTKTTTYPDGRFAAWTYDKKDNIISKKLGDGSVINYQYDSLNRMVTKSLPDGNVYNYTYDADGRMITAANSSGVTGFTYDALNRITSETFNNHTTRYQYNVSGRSLTTIYPDSTVIVKNYDTRNRLINITKNNSVITTYQYNIANYITAITSGNGINTAFQYDFANRLNNLSTGNGNVQNKSFTYDKNQNKTSVSNLVMPSLSEQFTYDNRYRLTNYKQGATGGAPALQNTYQYDAVGNRTSANMNGVNTSYTANNLNQLTNSNNGTQNVDFTYDNNGNLTYDGIFYKKYDAEKRLLVDSASPSNKITYKYDALGRRSIKTINGTGIRYYYSGLSQIEQTDSNTDTMINKTVFGNFIMPVLMEKNNAKYYYHQNELNSVEAITGSTGNLVERYQYDPYGKQTIYDAAGNVINNSLINNRFSFTGQEYDKETGTYHFHYRNYSPATGTFNQRDPIGYGDEMGLYQYVNDNPANGVDIFGLAPCPPTAGQTVTDGLGHTTNWTAILNYLRQLETIRNEKNKLVGIGDGADNLSKRSSKFSKFNIAEQAVNLTAQVNKYIKDEPYLSERGKNTRIAELETGLAGLAGDIAETKFPNNPFSKAATYLGVADAISNELTGKSLAKYYADLDVTSIKIGNKLLQKAEERYISDAKKIDAARKLFGDDQKNWTDDIRETYERHQKAAKTYTQTNTSDWIPGYDPNNCPPQTTHGTQKPPLPPNHGPYGIPFSIEFINSHDPNEIIGPDGYGIPKWVSVKDNLPYTINFENSKSASAPAKKVRVNYPIDPKQDKSTFALGSFGFNNLTFSVPPATASYYQRLNTVDSLGIYVDVTAGLDVVNNQAFWIFESIDRNTLLPVTNPLQGFLLLQDTAQLTKGHGFVNFTIKPLSTDVTRDTMHATAAIVFDGNDTIPTNYAKNTIDAVAPSSHMNATPSVSYTNTFPLSWGGTDDAGGSGVRHYTLYYSVNNGVYAILRSGITRTDTTFTGSNDNTYRFFVLATDTAYNVEALKPAAEVTVLVNSGVILPVTWLSFTASLKGKDGVLNWATATEINSKMYIIERSVNGRAFVQIGSLNAVANSTVRTNYGFIDSNVVTLNIPLVYYRLKQLDKNGNYTYSAIVAVALPTVNLAPSVQVYPNPFKQALNLMMANMPATTTGDQVSLYTLDGKIVYSKTTASHGANATITLDDMPSLTPGIYMLKLISGKQTYTFKLMKE